MVNTYSLNNNKEGHAYYQNGFAYNFWEHFGLYANLSKRVVTVGKFELEGFLKLIVTRHGLKTKDDRSDADSLPPGRLSFEIYKTFAAPAFELDFGPRLNYNVNDRLSIKALLGVGLCVFYYQNEGISLVTGQKFYIAREIPNRIREWEFVGGGTYPMLGLGLVYNFKK